MITKIKKVYYCEFCKKHSLLPLTKHEKHCTMNPNRICGVCGNDSMAELIKKYSNRYKWVEQEFNDEIKWTNGKVTTENIKDDVENCPACTLAIIRICKLKETFAFERFDYKEEMKEWWNKINEQERERDEFYSIYG